MNLSDVFHTENGICHFDFNNTIQYLEFKGRQLLDPNFKIFEEDYETIYKILIWVVKDFDNCKNNGIEVNKGILLSGPIGCGKTSLMRLIVLLLGEDRKFILKSSRDITLEFNRYGFETINKYGKQLRFKKPICLDDIGIEPRMKYFGNDINVIKEIILCRYELYRHRGVLTHATTNLGADQLEKYYGSQVRSRMRIMFNLIYFTPKSRDKRR